MHTGGDSKQSLDSSDELLQTRNKGSWALSHCKGGD